MKSRSIKERELQTGWRYFLLPEDTSVGSQYYPAGERFGKCIGCIKLCFWIIIAILTGLIFGNL